MALDSFLSELFADGRVRVATGSPLPEDWGQVDTLLLAFERERRDDLPAEPPEILVEAARFGAAMLYLACQYLVFRDIEPETIQQEMSRQIECPLSPSTHYSVDLTLRYLPDVVRLARGTSQEDPLVTELLRLAGRWPLSAVGIEGVDVGDVTGITDDECLLRVYVDRVLARQDYCRLESQRVRDAALQAIGAFPELAPAAAAVLGINDTTQESEDSEEAVE